MTLILILMFWPDWTPVVHHVEPCWTVEEGENTALDCWGKRYHTFVASQDRGNLTCEEGEIMLNMQACMPEEEADAIF